MAKEKWVRKMQLTLNVDYMNDEGTAAPDPDMLRGQLESMIRREIGNGGLTGDCPDLLVEGYNFAVSDKGVRDLNAKE